MDAGGGDSTLVDDLIELGFEDLTVLDMSAEALSNARRRLGEASEKVHWIEADIEHVKLPADPYDLWHDRALFHFLTTPEARSAYLEILEGALKPGGYAIFATFADDGPEQCSGLPTERYSTEKLLMVLGSGFDLIESERQVHLTPGGSEQRFLYSLFRKQPSFNIAGNP
jgi:SAM-dependent methyltransferase